MLLSIELSRKLDQITLFSRLMSHPSFDFPMFVGHPFVNIVPVLIPDNDQLFLVGMKSKRPILISVTINVIH